MQPLSICTAGLLHVRPIRRTAGGAGDRTNEPKVKMKRRIPIPLALYVIVSHHLFFCYAQACANVGQIKILLIYSAIMAQNSSTPSQLGSPSLDSVASSVPILASDDSIESHEPNWQVNVGSLVVDPPTARAIRAEIRFFSACRRGRTSDIAKSTLEEGAGAAEVLN